MNIDKVYFFIDSKLWFFLVIKFLNFFDTLIKVKITISDARAINTKSLELKIFQLLSNEIDELNIRRINPNKSSCPLIFKG